MSAYDLVIKNNRIVDLKHSGRPGTDDTINIPAEVKSVEFNIFQTYDVRKINVANRSNMRCIFDDCAKWTNYVVGRDREVYDEQL